MPWPSSASCGASKLHLDLASAVAAALELLKGKISRTAEETALEVLDFFKTRLQHLLLTEGFDHETITAVLAAGGRDVVDAADKVQALAAVRQSPEFPSLALAFKRVINIAQTAEPGEVDPALFQYGEENILYQSAKLMETQVTEALERRDYPGVCRALAGLRGPVDAFFEKVLVMAEDAQSAPQPAGPAVPYQPDFSPHGRFLEDYDVIAMRRWFRRKGKEEEGREEEAAAFLPEETEPGSEAAGEDASGEPEAASPEAARPDAGPEASDPALPEALTDAAPARRGFLRRWRRESQPEDAAPDTIEAGAAEAEAVAPAPEPQPNPLAPGTAAGPPHRPRAGVSRAPARSRDGGRGARSPGGRGPGGDRGGSRGRGPAVHVPAPAGTVGPDPGGPGRRSGSALPGAQSC